MPKKTYTVKEVARLLGFSTNTVYKYLEEGKIKSTRLGKEGRFRVPDAEMSRLLQESKGVEITEQPSYVEQAGRGLLNSPSNFLEEDGKHSPSLFDWFICFLSIALGFSQVVFPAYSVSSIIVKFLPSIQILQGLLFFAGFGLIAFDVLGLDKNYWHNILHVFTGALYFIIAVIFIFVGVIPNAIGYFAVAAILIFTAFIKPAGSVRFVIYLFFLLLFIGLGAVIWPGNFFVHTMAIVQGINTSIFYSIWIASMVFLVFLGLKVLKGSKKALTLISVLVSVLSLIFSILAFTNGFWGRAIYTVVLGSFAAIFPFADHFEAFTLRSRNELVVSFLWLLGLFFVGSLVLYFVYHSFQSYILSELEHRVNTASEVLSTFVKRNESKVQVFAQSSQLVNLLKGNPKTNTPEMDSYLRQLYLSSNGTLRRVILTNKDGIIIDTYPYNLSSQGVSVANRDYFINVKSGLSVYLTGIVQPNSPGISPAVLVSAAVDNDKGEFLGTLTGSTDIKELANEINQVRFGQNGAFILADTTNRYIIPPRNLKALDKVSTDSLVYKAVSGESGVKTGYDEGGTLSFSAYRRVDPFGWGVVAEQPFNEAFRAYSIAGFVTFLVFIMSGIGSLILVIYIRRNTNKNR